MLDDLQRYLQLASGLTEATTAKAREVITGLVSTGLSVSSKAVPAPEVMGQVQELADDLVATSRNNRDMLSAMIRTEVDKAVGRMGFVREDELAALRRHVQRLERQLADMQVGVRADMEARQEAAQQSRGSAPASAAAPQSAPVDAVGEAVEPERKKKKKIVLDPDGESAS